MRAITAEMIYKSKTGANGLKNMITKTLTLAHRFGCARISVKGQIPGISDVDHWEAAARVSSAGSTLYLRYLGDIITTAKGR